MKRIAPYIIGIILSGIASLTHGQTPAATQSPTAQPTPARQAASNTNQAPMPPGPNPNSQYRLGPDSLPQEGVPKGEIRGPFTLPSNVYAGTQHTYWVYVPAQYDPAVPAALMIYQDGQAFKSGEWRHPRTDRDGQLDLPPRDPGNDRRLYQSRTHAGAT